MKKTPKNPSVDGDQPHKSPESSSAYTLPSQDLEFLAKDESRSLRLQLELMKPEWYLQHENVRSTIVVFGSARILSPETAEQQVADIEAALRETPNSANLQRDLKLAKKQQDYARYYAEAHQFSSVISQRFQQEDKRDFVVITGGGPGIMEAANRGAHEAGERSIGLNITLPFEQAPNPYVSPELSFQFRYFAIRKMHFLLRAKALVAFPGGFGTMDEIFDVLTLLQTNKIEPIPVILIGRDFWSKAINFEFLADEHVISPDDLSLFQVVDHADEAIGVINSFYEGNWPD